MSKHLVAGGSGYFGSVLVEALIEKGFIVRVYDIGKNKDLNPNTEFYQGDIRDKASIDRACEGVDVVYNVIAQVPLARDRKIFNTVNIDGTRNLLAAARKQNVKKVIHVSTSAVYGVPKENPVIEDTDVDPRDPYGKAKLEAENIVRQFSKEGLDVTVIRPRTILGHGRMGIFSIVFNWIKDGYNVAVLGKGDNKYQFVHASDLANACMLAAQRQGHSLYNIGASDFGTMRELLEGLIEHAGKRSKVRSLPFGPTVFLMRIASILHLAPFAPYHWLMYGREMYFDISKAKEELNWMPTYSNSEMIGESYDSYCSRPSDEGGSLHQRPVKEGLLNIVKRII